MKDTSLLRAPRHSAIDITNTASFFPIEITVDFYDIPDSLVVTCYIDKSAKRLSKKDYQFFVLGSLYHPRIHGAEARKTYKKLRRLGRIVWHRPEDNKPFIFTLCGEVRPPIFICVDVKYISFRDGHRDVLFSW